MIGWLLPYANETRFDRTQQSTRRSAITVAAFVFNASFYTDAHTMGAGPIRHKPQQQRQARPLQSEERGEGYDLAARVSSKATLARAG